MKVTDELFHVFHGIPRIMDSFILSSDGGRTNRGNNKVELTQDIYKYNFS